MDGAQYAIPVWGSVQMADNYLWQGDYLNFAVNYGMAFFEMFTLGYGTGLTQGAAAGSKAVGSGAAKGRANLLNAANSPNKGGLTEVGRALQKHGSRQGSLLPKATGNVASINTQGEAVLKNIISHPNATTVTRHHARFGNIMEIKIPNGQGARFSADGKIFYGFIE